MFLAGIESRANTVSARLPDKSSMVIVASGHGVRASIEQDGAAAPRPGRAVGVDRRITAAMRQATQIIAVAGRGFSQDGRDFVVLGVAIPSVAKQGSSYCGAGSEDYVLLIEWHPRSRTLKLRDRLRVQSCLQSMELQSDQGSDLRVVLRGVADPARVDLTWLQHPRYGPATKTLTIGAGKFILSP